MQSQVSLKREPDGDLTTVMVKDNMTVEAETEVM